MSERGKRPQFNFVRSTKDGRHRINIQNERLMQKYAETTYLSDDLWATPTQLIVSNSRARLFSNDTDDSKRGDGYVSGSTTNTQTRRRPIRLHDHIIGAFDRKRMHKVRRIEPKANVDVPGWISVEISYFLSDGKTVALSQELPSEVFNELSDDPDDQTIADDFDSVWNLEDELQLLKRLFSMQPRLNVRGNKIGDKLRVSDRSYALWRTYPKIEIHRRIHPTDRMHDPTKGPEYNKELQVGWVIAYDKAPNKQKMNITIHLGKKKKYYAPDALGLHLAGWRVKR